jgi:hypothetical protein
MQNLVKLFLSGWKLIIERLLELVKKLYRCIRKLLAKHKKEKDNVVDVCCLKLPDNIRAQPDPYIYSQEWLMKRGFAVTWDNPDFRIIEDATGNVADRLQLKPDTVYRIRVTIHNNSIMAAINTQLSISIGPFGISSGTIIGSAVINNITIAGFGSTTAEFKWLTPNSVGHICLRATIYHIDDANPFNNTGQHNTVIKEAAKDKIVFTIRNKFRTAENIYFKFDTYQLPAEVSLPKTMEERNSKKYLEQLQEKNNPEKFILNPVDLGFTIDGIGRSENPKIKNQNYLSAKLEGKKELEPTLHIPATSLSNTLRQINVTAFFESGQLIGGFTIINKT